MMFVLPLVERWRGVRPSPRIEIALADAMRDPPTDDSRTRELALYSAKNSDRMQPL